MTTNDNNYLRPFHLAFPVKDLEETRKFYTDILGCKTGRTSELWIDFNFFGHQVSAHLAPGEVKERQKNVVDGKKVPVLHSGIILEWGIWQELKSRLQEHNIHFFIKPYIRFEGQPGEQATMFLLDPSGNALEFKAFKNDTSIFATE